MRDRRGDGMGRVYRIRGARVVHPGVAGRGHYELRATTSAAHSPAVRRSRSA